MKKNKYKTKRIKVMNILKRIAIIIVLIIILVKNKNVYAGNQDSILVRNKVDGIYAIAPLSDRTHLYNLEMYSINNKATYCIEIGKKIVSTIYNSETNENEQVRISNLTKEQLDYIKLISYFGYNYPGDLTHNAHTNKEYYMASQELIWEYLNNIDITWTNELDINGNKINIDNYKNEIIELIKKYTDSIQNINEYSLTIGQQFNINNELLSYYNIKESGNQIVSLHNNILEFTADENYIGKDTITIKWNNVYNYPPTIYNLEDSQTLLSTGALPEKDIKMNFNISGVTLNTNIIDKDTKECIPSGQASLEGAIYELYDENNNLIETITTNLSCKNEIKNLYHKTYYLKQISPSKGYKTNTNIKTIFMNENKNEILEEEVIKSNIEINKLYEINDNYEREANIKFNIYDNNDKLYTNIITTKTGLNTIILPYGIYKIKQENTTYGYEKVPDIYININELSNPTIRYDLVDKKITTKIHITTKNKKTNKNIEEKNIKYRIKDKKTNKYLTYINSSNKIVDTFLTDEKGKITIPIKIPYGEYIIEQIEPPKNYLGNNQTIEIDINDKTTYSYIENEIVVNIDFFNTPIIGKLNILTNKEIINEENKIISIPKNNNEIDIYFEDELLNTYITNEFGNISISNLRLGTYCIIEKDTNQKECVEIIDKDGKKEIIEKNINIKEVINLKKEESKEDSNLEHNKKSIPIPNTISNINYILFILPLIFLAGVISYHKKKNNN